MATSAKANDASGKRTAALKRLVSVGGIVTPCIIGDTLEVVLPQNRNAPIAIEIGYLIAQIVYPWPDWHVARFDLRESYPAYMKYEAYLLAGQSRWHFINRVRKAPPIANIRQLRAATIEHLSQFHIELRSREKQGYTLFLIPHDLELPEYVMVAYLLAHYIYPHPIWQTKALQVATRAPAQIVSTVDLANQR
jgi:hypothetical protein